MIAIDKRIPAWHTMALCDGMDQEIFFGATDVSSAKPAMTMTQLKKAREICNACPVFEDCITYSLEEREAYGVWAGISRRTRLKILDIIDNNLVTIGDVVNSYCQGRGKIIEQIAKAYADER